MPYQLLSSFLSWRMKKRFYQIELFLKYPIEVQNELLFKLLNKANSTEIGKKYDFKSIKDYRVFSSRLPIVTYEDIAPYIERVRKGEQNIFWPTKIKWFAKSSGTTNAKSKFIPLSMEALQYCHYKAFKDFTSIYCHNNPNTKIFKGKNLKLGGSHEIYGENNSYYGDLSAILIENLPRWMQFVTAPSSKVALMSEWNNKLESIIKETVKQDITSIMGVPSWMLVLIKEILKHMGKNNLLEVWPNLELYSHGGVSFTTYKEQYQKLIPKTDFNYFESYNASEGFFAIQDRNNSNELLLMLDYGIFYEFIPMTEYYKENPKTFTLENVALEENYVMVISTNSGLWRYVVGDTVKFTSLNPYRIKITGRTKHYINVFGEELIVDNSDRALEYACAKTFAQIKDYTAGPVYMNVDESGAHQWIIEFYKQPKSIKEFTNLLDRKLKELNSDYEAKRYNNMTLKKPIVNIAPKNLFHNWLKEKGKLGGQNKVPRLANNREYLDQLLTAMDGIKGN